MTICPSLAFAVLIVGFIIIAAYVIQEIRS